MAQACNLNLSARIGRTLQVTDVNPRSQSHGCISGIVIQSEYAKSTAGTTKTYPWYLLWQKWRVLACRAVSDCRLNCGRRPFVSPSPSPPGVTPLFPCSCCDGKENRGGTDKRMKKDEGNDERKEGKMKENKGSLCETSVQIIRHQCITSYQNSTRFRPVNLL
jgi:hypothetical protein